jgi:hypothetical protein
MSKREIAAKISVFVFKFSQLEDDGEPVTIDGKTKAQVIAAARHLKEVSEKRAKAGKAAAGKSGRKPDANPSQAAIYKRNSRAKRGE